MTIAENIAYAKPGAPLADVRGAARLANAEGFILQMDGGYDARPGEKGVRISGGQ